MYFACIGLFNHNVTTLNLPHSQSHRTQTRPILRESIVNDYAICGLFRLTKISNPTAKVELSEYYCI